MFGKLENSYMRFCQYQLEFIDAALTFAKGHRPVVAKLCDLTVSELSSAIWNYRFLREKWATKRRGRPRRCVLPFPIREHCPEEAVRALRQAGLAGDIYKLVSEFCDLERIKTLILDESRRDLESRLKRASIPAAPARESKP